METIVNKRLVFIPEESEPIFVRTVFGENHIHGLTKIAKQEHILVQNINEEDIIKSFNMANYAVIRNYNGVGAFYLPTNLSENQIDFFDLYKEQIVSDYDIVSVGIYSEEPTKYNKHYRDIQLESLEKGDQTNPKELLYIEIDKQRKQKRH